MRLFSSSRAVSFALLSLPLPGLVQAMCECGYRTASSELWTDALVFPDWSNVDVNTAPDFFKSTYSRDPNPGETAGVAMDSGNVDVDGGGALRLTVRNYRKDGKVSSAEVVTTRKDILYGTFRVIMQSTPVPGTMGSISLLTDTVSGSSVDILLPSRIGPQSQAILDIRPIQTDVMGNPSTKSQQQVDVGSDPSGGWHEYRIDWFPGRTDYLVDGNFLTSLLPPTTFNATGGSLVLSHYASGSALLGTPPTVDATMYVLNVRAFFNSSDRTKNAAYQARCAASLNNVRSVCDVDSVVGTVLSANDAASNGGNFLGVP
ncbi:hypothetical protein HDU93_001679, partial [Gonapodya sp. JEL0774]